MACAAVQTDPVQPEQPASLEQPQEPPAAEASSEASDTELSSEETPDEAPRVSMLWVGGLSSQCSGMEVGVHEAGTRAHMHRVVLLSSLYKLLGQHCVCAPCDTTCLTTTMHRPSPCWSTQLLGTSAANCGW